MNWAIAHAAFGVTLVVGALIWLTLIIARPKLRPPDLFEVVGISGIIAAVGTVVGSAFGLIFS